MEILLNLLLNVLIGLLAICATWMLAASIMKPTTPAILTLMVIVGGSVQYIAAVLLVTQIGFNIHTISLLLFFVVTGTAIAVSRHVAVAKE